MTVRIIEGDCRETLKTLDAQSVQCCVTSPPYYGLRDYGHPEQLGLEKTPQEYVEKMVAAFREVKRVLRDDGTLWLNIGDSYATQSPIRVRGNKGFGSRKGLDIPVTAPPRTMGLKSKDLIGIPWMLAFALRADGWYLRSDIIWHKPNPMPESVTDRPTKSHEYVFLLSKSERYFYDADAIAEPITASSVARLSQDVHLQEGSARVPGKTNGNMKAVGGRLRGRPNGAPTFEKFGHNTSCGTPETGFRNARSVWSITTQPFKGAHFAVMPAELVERCIKAGSKLDDTILDPFAGAGTVGLVADRLGRNAILCELNAKYADMARNRINNDAPLFSEATA